ncbi:MAG: trypsin-like peptidase domain-containing protein [Bacillota bacterium]|nr:trypsin-like peptidase domain-containing protein [Bacillota bacterium]
MALIFLFTVIGSRLAVFSSPVFTFLRESWLLSDDPLVQEVRPAVVQIYVDLKSGSRHQLRGSGFNIDPAGLVVTNRHLLEEAANVKVSFPGRGTFTARGWHLSDYVDLALIELDSRDLPAVGIAEEPPVPGEKLLVIGNPLQYARVANMAVLNGYRSNLGRDFPHIVIKALIYPGSSGSPLFNGDGKVVGIVFATLRNSDDNEIKGLAVDARELWIFLDQIMPHTDLFLPMDQRTGITER